MKIAAVADVHLGNHRRHGGDLVGGLNTRARLSVQVFGAALYESAKWADVFVVAGDLIDTTNPTPQLLAQTQTAIKTANVPTNLVVGNHEQVSTRPGDHSLAPLWPVAAVIGEATVATDEDAPLIYVPYRDCENGLAMLLDSGAMTQHEGTDAVLFTHLGVKDGKTPPWLQGAHDCIDVDDLHKLMADHGIAVACVGNWHDHRYWKFDDGIEIVQCGALVPTGWDNATAPRAIGTTDDPYGSLIKIDTDAPRGERVTRQIIPGPRFVSTKSTRAAVDCAKRAKTSGDDLYLQITASVDARDSIRRELLPEIEARAVEVIVDKADVQARVESAAISAKDAKTVDRAVAEYVEAAPFATDVDRAEVLKRVRGYLAGAQG